MVFLSPEEQSRWPLRRTSELQIAFHAFCASRKLMKMDWCRLDINICCKHAYVCDTAPQAEHDD